MDARTALAPLRHRAFRRYLAGQLPSVTCSWAQVVALSAAVVALDPRALGWVVALQFLPSALLGPWFGAVVDRYDRRRVLMLAETGLAVIAAAFAVAAATGRLDLPLVALLGTAWGVVNAVDTPARRALTPMLVPPEDAASAAALSGTVLLTGMTAGAALGGLLVPAIGAAATFALNALSFAVDVAVLAIVRTGPSPRLRRAPHQVRDGVRYVWRTPMLRVPMLALAAVAATAFTFQVSVPILVSGGFDGGAGLIGVAMASVTGGCLAGTLVAAARGRPGPAALPGAAAAMAAGLLLTAVAPTPVPAFAGLAVVGVGWSLLISTVVAVLQRAEPGMMGRVMALFALVLLGGNAVGGPLAGWLSGVSGPYAPFVLGAVAAAATAAWLSRPTIRRAVAVTA